MNEGQEEARRVAASHKNRLTSVGFFVGESVGLVVGESVGASVRQGMMDLDLVTEEEQRVSGGVANATRL